MSLPRGSGKDSRVGSQICPLLVARTWVYSLPPTPAPVPGSPGQEGRCDNGRTATTLWSSERGEGGHSWDCLWDELASLPTPWPCREAGTGEGELSRASITLSVLWFHCPHARQLQALIYLSLWWKP